ncbi:unnamed protein product [Allacma fusca]|uniref:Uncharacterized protein n=1 Tax=Allacma fusca TaxID=39272 RepID=A0A8J2JYB1_9HEXA|nr:unnamed protein product [Allacma fusca]
MNLEEIPKVSAALSKNAQRSALNSLTKMNPGPRVEVGGGGGGSTATKTSKRKNRAKPYEPIRLPEDILTIQAHTVSTPVTELPYLLIAAHIGALPTARQFYPATSATHSPLTVFRDMFVMTIDVRGYKPSSVRLSTEGRLIIIECLQSEVPQVVFTQTGTVDTNNKYVMDPNPKVNELPVHTSFNYVQHRVKLPEDFSEEGLKVGMDDVSGHVIITGRLVHNQRAAFPEPWNQNKVVKKPKGPLVNTSSVNLSKEDARKLAAWNAVQSNPQTKLEEIGNTNFMAYGKKQWLEKEGAKLRAIQHRALKENIRKLTEMKKGNGSPPQPSSMGSVMAQVSTKNPQEKLLTAEGKISHKPRSNSSSQLTSSPEEQYEKPSGPEPRVKDTASEVTSISPKTLEAKVSTKSGTFGKSEPHGIKTPAAKGKESRPKVSFQHEGKSPLQNKKSQVKTDAGNKKRTPQRLKKNLRKQPKLEDRRKLGRIKTESNLSGISDAEEGGFTIPESQTSNPAPASSNNPEISKESKSKQSLNKSDGGTSAKNTAEVSNAEGTNSPVLPNTTSTVLPMTTSTVLPMTTSTVLPITPSVQIGEAEIVKIKVEMSEVPQSSNSPGGHSTMESGPLVESIDVKYTARTKSKSRTISSTSVRTLEMSPQSPVSDTTEGHSGAINSIEVEDGDDPVGKQDKAMWEKLLNFAGVRRKQKSKSRSPDPKT